MPLSEKARIEVYLPDLPRPAYEVLLEALEQEFSYAFGGCTTIRGLEGKFLSRAGAIVRDRINIVYTDTPFGLQEHFSAISRYTDEIRDAAFRALDEEAVFVVAMTIYHSE